MSKAVYSRLAEHLDTLPGGFPPSHTGAEIPLLQRLFTEEEAELACCLSLERETSLSVAERTGADPVSTESKLAAMAKKGLIFSVHPQDGEPLYQAAPLVVGIYEYQVGNLDEELAGLFNDYWTTQKRKKPVRTIRQMRTIPIGRSIDPTLEVYPYHRVKELVEAHSTFAVAPCICRLHSKLEGNGCDGLNEACLMFGEWADFYVRGGMGRYIELEEVKEILETAEAQGLVLQPSNSREIAAICCCCSCCCGILRGIYRHPRPSHFVSSVYIAELDIESCLGCGVCISRCPMDALSRDDAVVSLDQSRCIGCGLCVTRCPSDALRLTVKDGVEPPDMPASMDDTWKRIFRDQSEALK